MTVTPNIEQQFSDIKVQQLSMVGIHKTIAD